MVTQDDKPRFKAAFNVLAVATRLRADDTDPAMHRIYFDGLSELPIEAIEAGARELAKGSQWFPKVAEWITAAKQARSHADLKALVGPARDEDWRHECAFCEDTGWSYENGQTLHEVVMGGYEGRPRTQRCVCRATNLTYQRHWRAQFGERVA